MKFAKIIVFAAIATSVSAHAALTTGEMPTGTVNCTGQVANPEQKAEGLQEAKRVFADNSATQKRVTPQSTGNSKTSR